MTDCSEKSGSLISDKLSVETRISTGKYHRDAGDGPQISYPFVDLHQFSLHELNTDDLKILPQNIDSDIKTSDDLDNTSTPENHKMRINQIKIDEKDKLSTKDGFSNKTFTVSSMNNLAILDIFKDIQSTINQLKLSNCTAKNQISNDLTLIGSFMVSYEFSRQIKSTFPRKDDSRDSEIQRLQMFLLYILEQLNHLNGTIIDTQSQIAKLLTYKSDESHDHKLNGKTLINGINEKYKLNLKHSEAEEDVFSVEELSWDEHQLTTPKIEQINTNDQIPEPHITLNCEITQTKNELNSSDICQIVSSIVNKNDLNNDEESNEDESMKNQHSKSITQHLTDNFVIEKFNDENIEKSNSFQEIKKKFENLNFSPTLPHKKDASSSSSLKAEKDLLNFKRSGSNPMKSKISKHEDENLSKKHDDDCVDNSAFLVSSIDSFTDSISFTNPNNNNNRFSDKYKSNIAEQKESSPTFDIDIVGEKFNLLSDSGKDLSKSVAQDVINQSDPYIEVVSNVNSVHDPVFIDSPYVNYQNDKASDSKSSTSSSEHIVAMGKLVNRFRNILKKDNDLENEYSPIFHHMKKLIESEKIYVKNLFIYSQVLYNRIKVSNIISQRNFNIMFPNCIHSLYKLHVGFCDQLNAVFQQTTTLEPTKDANKHKIQSNKIHTMKFGQIFLENLENDNWKFFSLYRKFYGKCQFAVSMFNKLKKNSPKFERLIKILLHNEHCNELELGEFILLPIQRLPQYLSILRRILEKLTSTQIDEKIPMVAIEHLLECFINEVDSKHFLNYKKSQCKTADASLDSSHVSMKCHSLNGMTVKEPNTKSQGFEEKPQMFSKLINAGNIKKFWSQSALVNNPNKESRPNLNSYSPCDSISLGNQSNKDTIHISSSLGQINHSHSHEIAASSKDRKSDHCKFHLVNVKYSVESKSAGDDKLSTKLFAKHQKNVSPTHNVLRPQSVPLKQKIPKSRKSPLCTNKFDTESLISQITEECSVCLNSQEEFEIDTSMEEDDKTYTAESNVKMKEKNHSSKSSQPDHSLSTQNSLNFHLIECCSDTHVRHNSPNLVSSGTGKHNSVKWFLSEENKFSILNNLLLAETDYLINRKVENTVLILCNVLIETTRHEFQISACSFTDKVAERNEISSTVPIRYIELIEKSPSHDSPFHNSTEFCLDQEKKDSKRFSIKQLFSLRRKSRVDKISQPDYGDDQNSKNKCEKRSISRLSLQKRHSITNKNTDLKFKDFR